MVKLSKTPANSKRKHVASEEDFSLLSFQGIPIETFDFLKKLKKNNNREWFDNHKDDYETFYRLPMIQLVSTVRQLALPESKQFKIDPKKSIYRIYRDVRFSQDKSPYKTHLSAFFETASEIDSRGKMSRSGFYIHIDLDDVFVGGGLYQPDSIQLKNIRNIIAENEPAFFEFLDAKSFKSRFPFLEGDRLKSLPKGFQGSKKVEPFLKLKQFLVRKRYEPTDVFEKDFAHSIALDLKAATPFLIWLQFASEGHAR